MPLDQTQPAAATFVFADIAGFTALTEAHGDEQAAHLVADFCDAVAAELPAFGGTQIKTIGDALMLRIADAQHAVLLRLRIAHDVLTGHGARSVRVGMHHAPTIERNATTSAPRSISPRDIRRGKLAKFFSLLRPLP